MKEVIQEAVEQVQEGQPCVLATVVRTKGSTPQKSGAMLLVRQDGTGVGTLGGGCVEGDIWFAAKEILRNQGGRSSKTITSTKISPPGTVWSAAAPCISTWSLCGKGRILPRLAAKC